MERLRELLAHISAQLAVLTLSQRIAIGLCAALVAASVFWLLQWSTEPEYVPVVSEQFEHEQLTAGEDALKASGIKFVTRGNRLYVRSAELDNAKRVLFKADVVAGEQLFDMATLMANQNPFQAPEARRTQETYARGNELARIITTSPLIERARVIINPVTKRRLGRESNVPTASVVVTMARGEEVGQGTVDWLAKLVSGAVSGLKPYNVFVSDASSGRAFNVPRPEDAVGLGYLAEVKKRENHLTSKVLDVLAYIPGVRATVSVELDTQRRSAESYIYDKPQPKKEKASETQSNAGGGPAESGMQANLGTALVGNQSGQTSSTEDSETENYPANIKKTERTEDQALSIIKKTATVSIPRSFIVSLYKLKNAEAAEPSDEDLAAEQQAEVARVTKVVQRVVMADDPSDIQVAVVPDLRLDGEGALGWGDAGVALGVNMDGRAPSAVELARSYGPQAGLGLLAFMSMIMMMRIVRKSSQMVKKLGPMGEEIDEGEGGILNVGPTAVGQAAASESVLLGREVDDETVRYAQLGEEVSRMVDDDPEGAADLIRRWVDDQDA